MIQQDQPRCFSDDVTVYVSSADDGAMLDKSLGAYAPTVVARRQKFCDSLGVDYGDMVYVEVIYDDKATYRLVTDADDRLTSKHVNGIVTDGLFTDQPGMGMMLPVADCVATVVHDPVRKYLALLHLGRHSTVAGLMARGLEHFRGRGSQMSDLIVWMSPSAQKQSYRLDYFTEETKPQWKDYIDARQDGIYIDMQGYNRSVCISHGVTEANIHLSPVDTVTSSQYFSHSAGDTIDRFAVLAMMR